MKAEKVRSYFQKEIQSLMEEISGVFANKSGRELARSYIQGLFGPAERKNGWQLAEELGYQTPYRIQQFVYRGRWSADELRDALRRYAIKHLGETDGVLVVDETGFLKQGRKSCGVMRQYSGTAGKVANCQVGVFLVYSTSKGFTFLDRKLYLPQEWLQDEPRCREAGIPEGTEFQTKPQMALSMLKEAYETGVPFSWVTGDSVYGDYRKIRTWLESEETNYVLCVSGKEYVWRDFEQIRISALLETLGDAIWNVKSAGNGSKGKRLYEWCRLPLNPPLNPAYRRWLLVRRSLAKKEEMRAYVCYAPATTSLEKLAEVAGRRWTIETSFAESKSEVGMDQYEVRSYGGWYKHITLSCVAHAFLTILRSMQCDPPFDFSEYAPSESSMKEFKRGRHLSA